MLLPPCFDWTEQKNVPPLQILQRRNDCFAVPLCLSGDAEPLLRVTCAIRRSLSSGCAPGRAADSHLTALPPPRGSLHRQTFQRSPSLRDKVSIMLFSGVVKGLWDCFAEIGSQGRSYAYLCRFSPLRPSRFRPMHAAMGLFHEPSAKNEKLARTPLTPA